MDFSPYMIFGLVLIAAGYYFAKTRITLGYLLGVIGVILFLSNGNI
jgi:hypothetical protein